MRRASKCSFPLNPAFNWIDCDETLYIPQGVESNTPQSITGIDAPFLDKPRKISPSLALKVVKMTTFNRSKELALTVRES